MSIGIFRLKVLHLLCLTGGRMRYRGGNSNNPNLMFHSECDRRMRPGGGSGGSGGGSSGSSKDGRSGFNRDNRSSRDGGHSNSSSSSSYRDRSDRRNSFNSGSEQYQSYSGSSGYNSRPNTQSAGSGSQEPSGQPQGQFGQPPPPPVPTGGPMPLMAQPYALQQPPLLGFMGQPPYPFASPPPPGPPPPRK